MGSWTFIRDFIEEVMQRLERASSASIMLAAPLPRHLPLAH